MGRQGRAALSLFAIELREQSRRFLGIGAPGEGLAFDQVTVNDRRACQGKLFFYIPGGVQPGRYVLGIDLQEDEIRIPFTLEAK